MPVLSTTKTEVGLTRDGGHDGPDAVQLVSKDQRICLIDRERRCQSCMVAFNLYRCPTGKTHFYSRYVNSNLNVQVRDWLTTPIDQRDHHPMR